MKILTNIEAMIVDVDGTLIDSNDAHAYAFVDAFKLQGQTIPYELIRPYIGMGSDHLFYKAAQIEIASDLGRRVQEQKKIVFMQNYLPYVRPFAKTRELLQTLRANGLRLIVASSGEKEQIQALLEKVGGMQYFEALISSEDADTSKPDPDIVVAAQQRLDLPVDRMLMLGDTPYDIESARRASIATIAFCCGGWDRRYLRDAMAIYDDPADFLQALADLNYARPPASCDAPAVDR